MPSYERIPKPDDFVPSPTWPEGHRWHGLAGRCRAWNAKHGRQCLRRSSKGMTVCKKDGGASPKGPASANYKHGGRSKHMPKILQPAFESVNRDEILDLTETIMTQEAIALVIMKEMDSAAGTIFSETMQERLAKTDESKRKLVETEIKRREKMREAIQIEDAVVLYRQLVQANKDEIMNFPKLSKEDAVRLLNAIVGRFAAIAGRPDPVRSDAGDRGEALPPG